MEKRSPFKKNVFRRKSRHWWHLNVSLQEESMSSTEHKAITQPYDVYTSYTPFW